MTKALFFLGVFLGWATSPVVWPISLTPIRLMLYLGSFVGQESGWNISAHNTAGEDSIGLLQFNTPARVMLGMSEDDARSAFWSGYYGVKYVSELLLSDWRYWLYLRIPVLGLYWLRAAWRGFGAADTLEAGGVLAPLRLPGDSLYQTEDSVIRSYWSGLPVAFIGTAALVYGVLNAKKVKL